MNLAFHLGSAIAALFFAVWLIRLRSQREMLRQLMQSHTHKKLIVGWPIELLGRCCRALDVPFECGMNWRRNSTPVKVDLASIANVFTRFDIQGVAVRTDGEGSSEGLIVDVYTQDQPSDDTAPKLAAALGDRVRVQFQTSSASG